MSDQAKEAVNDARVRIRKLASRLLVQKETHEKDLAALEGQRAQIATEASGVADRPDLARQYQEILKEIDAKIAAKREDVARAEQYHKDALAELDQLKGAERTIERGEVQRLTATDPFAISPVDRALENVRSHIDELETRASLESELSGGLSGEPGAPAQAAPAVAKLTPEQQLAELKARRQRQLDSGEGGGQGAGGGGGGGQGGGEGGGEGGDGGAPKGPKRTL